MPAVLEEAEKINLKTLVDRGSKLYREIQPLKRKEEELEQIKAILRDEAKGKEIEFTGTNGTVARVEQKPDTCCRVVAEEDVLFVAKVAGPNLTELFTLHPSKGPERSFELNVLKRVTKRAEAVKLIERLLVPATAWVRFS